MSRTITGSLATAATIGVVAYSEDTTIAAAERRRQSPRRTVSLHSDEFQSRTNRSQGLGHHQSQHQEQQVGNPTGVVAQSRQQCDGSVDNSQNMSEPGKVVSTKSEQGVVVHHSLESTTESGRQRGGMVSVQDEVETTDKNRKRCQKSGALPGVITPDPATLRKCQSTQVSSQKLPAKESDIAWTEYCNHERMTLRQRRTRTKAVQFQILTQVGQGGFGEVFLARKSDTNELCALKRMSKKHLHLQDEVQHILTERDVLTATRSEWHVRLLYSFQDHEYVYLAMEFVQGGDVRTMLTARGVLHEEDAKLYFAEMVMAIDALHQQGYIHRDLKPENFLIDETGHVKLTDFGLSKGQLAESRIEAMKEKLEKLYPSRVLHHQEQQQQQSGMAATASTAKEQMYRNEGIRRAFSIVGSADYMAPEILASKGYDFGVDYWSLGCILFEFLSGYSPFQGEDTRQTCVNVWHWRRVLKRPVYDTEENMEFNLTDEAWDLITKLIADRGDRTTSLEQVKGHPWLAGLDWSKLRTTKASFVPVLSTPMDTSYFDDFTNPEDMAGYKDVLLRHAHHHHAATVGATSSSATTGGDDICGSLPRMLRAQDPWKGAFVGFTFRHQHK
ncbi:hypothetical protein BG004_003585 [Podila humilis]|nr:hypothetical protein BG004_003585 [Podila humilis]